MKRFICLALIFAACSEMPADKTRDEPVVAITQNAINLLGTWQSVEDTQYTLNITQNSYHELYDGEEMSRDQWQAVESCDNPVQVAKGVEYSAFETRTDETVEPVCYTIEKLGPDQLDVSYAGSIQSYKRIK